ncbi:MAG: leucyl aminopeptidase [Candidatus Micrarchaeota archaeon]
MKLSVVSHGYKFSSDAAVFGLFEGERAHGELAKIDSALGGALARVLDSKEFSGKTLQMSVVHASPASRLGFGRIMLIGLGKKADISNEVLRDATGKSAVALRERGAKSVASFILDGVSTSSEQHAAAVAEAAVLSQYRFDKYKTVKEDCSELAEFFIVVSAVNEKKMAAAVKASEAVANAVNHVRAVLNEPANVITPRSLAAAAKEMARQRGIKCKVLEEADMKKLGMNSLLSVSRGSREPPTFTVLEYEGRHNARPIVIVGKGVTFDSGGISIKPSKEMDRMKFDKSGAVAVMGIMQAAADLKLPVHLIGLMPASENLPGGNASKPGDIVKAMNGKTIEILNTDAEGRLMLADALSYAQQYKPSAVIDLATLTGAVVVALGDKAAGVLGNDEALISKLRKAGDACGERLWQLPLWKEYDEDVKSDWADVKNIGANGAAGTISGAAFLKKFAGDAPWAHLDIAGVAWTDKDKPYLVKGATGFGVRLVVQYLRESR